jgi:hypothetical protein
LDLLNSNIVLERNRMVVSVAAERVREQFNQRLRAEVMDYDLLQAIQRLQPPPGRDRHIASYHSLQHQFPENYGIGVTGLPESATPQRKAQAQQLKAYLLFFDQLLANYFAQLAHVRDLFSFTANSGTTYFAQALTDPDLNLDKLRRQPEEYEARLAQITENPDNGAVDSLRNDRRNRFLNHLLARFAERFTDFSLIVYGSLHSLQEGDTVAAHKQAFLRDYIEISRRRGSAFNYLQPLDDANRSGLEKRIQHQLGMTNERFYMVEHILLRPLTSATGDILQKVPFLGDASAKDPFSLQLSFIFPQDAPRFWDAETGQLDPQIKEFVARTVREETPAHLIATIHWLNSADIETFLNAYRDWLEQRRLYFFDKMGMMGEQGA